MGNVTRRTERSERTAGANVSRNRPWKREMWAKRTCLRFAACVAVGCALMALGVGNTLAAKPGAQATHGCDPLVPQYCMYPFPDNYFTVPDPGTPTGIRLNLQRKLLPRSSLTDHRIDPAAWNRNDGFSPGAMILTVAPHVDLKRSGAPTVLDIARSLSPKSSILLLNAKTLKPQLIWAELNENHVTPGHPRTLIIRVAKNLAYGQRYIVVLRNLVSAAGKPLQPSRAFLTYLQNLPSKKPAINARRAHMESLFHSLTRAGISRHGLYLVWDFTVASEHNLTGRALAIRNKAFRHLGRGAPDFQVTQVKNFSVRQNPQILREVDGYVVVPNYLDEPPPTATQKDVLKALAPYFSGHAFDAASVKAAFATMAVHGIRLPHFHYASPTPGPEAVPTLSGVPPIHANFECRIPRSAAGNDGKIFPAHLAIYGHGLFGSRHEINTHYLSVFMDKYDFIDCAVNWLGFAKPDVSHAIFAFMDLSYSRSFFDSVQQGFLDQLFLAKVLVDPDGFASNAAFQLDGKSLLNTSAVYYTGNSQGGILGGAVLALSRTIRRGVLGVPGMNYAFLIDRSVDFAKFAPVFYAAYPNSWDEQLALSLWQTLWDRADADGYAAAMTSAPLPGTPPHQALLQVAYGDHQVSMLSAEVEARTIGAQLHCPALAPDRLGTPGGFLGLPCLHYHEEGEPPSAMVIFDTGAKSVAMPPTADIPPHVGHDPHEDPRRTPSAELQAVTFLLTGKVANVCGDRACMATRHDKTR